MLKGPPSVDESPGQKPPSEEHTGLRGLSPSVTSEPGRARSRGVGPACQAGAGGSETAGGVGARRGGPHCPPLTSPGIIPPGMAHVKRLAGKCDSPARPGGREGPLTPAAPAPRGPSIAPPPHGFGHGRAAASSRLAPVFPDRGGWSPFILPVCTGCGGSSENFGKTRKARRTASPLFRGPRGGQGCGEKGEKTGRFGFTPKALDSAARGQRSATPGVNWRPAPYPEGVAYPDAGAQWVLLCNPFGVALGARFGCPGWRCADPGLRYPTPSA
jgi:hypothetical protein